MATRLTTLTLMPAVAATLMAALYIRLSAAYATTEARLIVGRSKRVSIRPERATS